MHRMRNRHKIDIIIRDIMFLISYPITQIQWLYLFVYISQFQLTVEYISWNLKEKQDLKDSLKKRAPNFDENFLWKACMIHVSRVKIPIHFE